MAIPRVQKLVAIFWPSFIVAGIANALVFTVIDPHEIVGTSWFANLDRYEAYTVGFLFLWVATACACYLTCYFQRPEHRIPGMARSS